SGVGTFYIPSWFSPQKGSQAVASYIAGVQGTVTSAIGYVSPDFTTIDPNSNAVLSNGAKSQLRVASVSNGTHYALPDNTSVEL
ncbi:hypothetical protein, partial [Enterococcus faecalis]|uniref:hypothetical protein n=1 Tax=Enterococcus faecalis TaxID=1351 RepID=UPI00403FB111